MGIEALLASLPEWFAAGGAADAGAGLATIGAGAAEAGAGAAAGAGGLADIVGTGAGLFGGTTGLEGTALAAGAGGDIASLIGTGAGGTLGALGTAESFLAAPGASGFSAGALTPGFGAPGGGAGTLEAAAPPPQPYGGGGVTSLSSNVANANGSASVFDTGTAGLTPSPGVTPGGASASSLSAPQGVTSALGADPTVAAPGGGALNAAPSVSAPSSIDSLVKGATDSLTKNALPTALGAAGLGYNILQGQKQSANQSALAADAAQATANSGALLNQGEALTQYLTNGTLPPAYQSQVDQAINDAKTKAIANAAAQGQPTDPTKNTALAQSLAAIDNQRGAMQTQVASQLFNSGAGLINSAQGAAGLSGQLYQTLVNNDTTQAANTGKAIATLAAALNGKSSNSAGGVTVSTG